MEDATDTNTELQTELVTEPKAEGLEEWAITVRQPWAWLIMRPDVVRPDLRAGLVDKGLMKAVENRVWPSKRRGRVWIHAGAAWDCDDDEARCRNLLMHKHALGVPGDLTLGAILGSVDMVDCVEEHGSEFFTGPFGFVFENPIPLAVPVPCKGKQKFFKLDADVAARVMAGMNQGD